MLASSWKLVGRAIRGALQHLQTREVFEPSEAVEKIERCLQELRPGNGTCRCCSKPLVNPLSAYSCDIDQAFEACHSQNVSSAWGWVSRRIEQTFSTQFVQVRRGREFAVKLGNANWSRGWVVLTLAQIGTALVAAAGTTLCALGSTVIELCGMSIGGTLSASAVAARLTHEEEFAFGAHQPGPFASLTSADIQWVRYVDDILSVSLSVCSGCLAVFFQGVYAESLSPVFSSDVQGKYSFVWLHLELKLDGPGLRWALKNLNREYLHGVASAKFLSSMVPWPGVLPVPFKQLRGILISKVVVAWSAKLCPEASAINLLEYCLELLRLGFPAMLVRGLVHSLPKWPETIIARRVFRNFALTLLACSPRPARSSSAMGYGDGRGRDRQSGGGNGGSSGNRGSNNRGSTAGGNQARRPRSPKKDDRRSDHKKVRGRRASSSSSSSSSSPGTRLARKAAKAQKLLCKADPGYAEWVKSRAENEEEARFRKQGQLLAGVLMDKFGPTMAASQAPHGQAAVGLSPQKVEQASASSHQPVHNPSKGGSFSVEQLEQIKPIVSSLAPTPTLPAKTDPEQIAQIKASLNIPEEKKPTPKAETPGTLSPLQVALVNSLFAGKANLSADSTLKDLEDELIPKWANRSVPDNLSEFISSHAPTGNKVAKQKVERIKQFWELVGSMN